MISHVLATALFVLSPGDIDAPSIEHNNSLVFQKFAKLNDHELSTVTGRQNWSMSRTNLQTIADDQRYGLDRFVVANSGVQMDVWWGTIGSQLIAESVRASAN